MKLDKLIPEFKRRLGNRDSNTGFIEELYFNIMLTSLSDNVRSLSDNVKFLSNNVITISNVSFVSKYSVS